MIIASAKKQETDKVICHAIKKNSPCAILSENMLALFWHFWENDISDLRNIKCPF
jgi:hypothetical protein